MLAALIIAPAVLFVLNSCNKDIVETTDNHPVLDPISTNPEAAGWQPFIATEAGLNIPAPAPVNSAAYREELAGLKAASSNLTAEQQDVINFWKVGSILRWNEIMRELVAKHNLPPFQNPDGSYPVPSATNPFSYPVFPFSNPPYAARAYAYVSIAQYDALIMAWKIKYQHHRPAPYETDGSISVSVPKSTLPAYPSEDAVIAGASLEIMRLLFPADVDYLNKMAEDEKNYRLWSGANVPSDIAAGDSLGRQVARQIIQRARGDGMNLAGGDAAMWSKMEEDTRARNEIPWISLESPKRPPMLPAFGNVKPILFNPAQLPGLLPPSPPPTASERMKAELEEIRKFTDNPSKERMRIVNFWADGVATYTPPGHWNAIAAKAFVEKRYSEINWARNYALLNAGMMDAAILCWNAKFLYFNPRPSQMNPKIKTLTGVPNFPSYISGHSTFSGAAAGILGYLLPEHAQEFSAMALEASNSRMYGGIHYRADCEEGLVAGGKIAALAIQRAGIDIR